MKFPKLYKRTSTGAIQEWEIFVEGDQFWTVSGQQNGKKIVHERTTVVPKNVGRANATTAEEQAILEATAKWTKQTEKHYSEDIQAIDDTEYFKVMLAKGYDARPKDKILWGNAYIQPKLDGIRLVVDENTALSRNGKAMGGGEVLKEEFKHLGLFEAISGLRLDGELYNHDFKDDFNSLVSLIKRDRDKISEDKLHEIKEHLQYHVYDVPNILELSGKHNYIQRIQKFEEILDDLDHIKNYIKLVPYFKVSSHEEVMEYYERFMGEGYEGAILRFDAPYENKRTWNLLKIKEFMDEEFTIVEVLEGVGKKANTAGSITMRLPDGRTFNSNIKGGYKVYDEIWKNKDKLVGKSATIQFFNYTEYGIPRFPYVIKIAREDFE